MTTVTDIVNRALQTIGTRTTVTASELANNDTNEAIQANLILNNMRDDLLRMAPWDCGMKTANLVYITSQPGTPENTSPATQLWQPGQPSPPWAYEYQYPADCLRACFIIPSTNTGFADAVPITTAVTGGASSYWWGQPIRFKVQNDQFRPVTAAVVANGGSGYVVGEVVTLATGPNTSPPIGAPAQLRVTAAPGGVISTVEVITAVDDSNPPLGGSYFLVQQNPVAQGSSDGGGTGATFNLTQGPVASQRVILTNQEFATLTYVQRITDPNVMDTLFQSAWINLLGSGLCMALTGDRSLANALIKEVNDAITSARNADGNEGLTINDVTPDFIRVRGLWYTEGLVSGPYGGYDWGGLFPLY